MKRFLTHPAIRRGALPGAAGALLFFLLPNLRGEGAPLWALGTTDGVGAEFAAGARDQVRFVVGQSVVSRDFPAEHGGSVGWDGRAQEKPYTLVFELRQAPSGRYELVL
ncbi:MAG: hypothetical protein NZ518_10620, partial [Dehalococcoidia bacterium]|nr:hypothetical protein [Dehalococcoidia bacterium]